MRTKKPGRVSRATATLALAAAAVFGGTLLTAVPAQAQQQQEAVAQSVFCPYRVTVNVANVRSGAGTSHLVRYHLYRGDTVLATQSQTNGFRMIRPGEWTASSNLTRTGGNCLTS
ncbi:SH3 domain-containing protein [Nocardiopsis valliformis]|uniref:hypothetical protein n=1 Tax=Nocardiopsis valliformis TaxID=239974 RepID=UPI0003468ED7|nr:hypothetical protein [Nocardiopsis valliformis]